MTFRQWLNEASDKGYDFYKNMILGKLSLDHSNGLSQNLDAWEPEQLVSILNGLGEFKELPQMAQDQAIGQIRSRTGTLGDLVRILSSSPRLLRSN
jgi:hypothetical protein